MNKIKNIFVALLIAASVSSCGLYAKFERPADLAETNSLYDYIAASQDTTNLANVEWRELFRDSDLTALIEQALANNTDYNVALKSVEQGETALKTAKLAFLPSLNLSADSSASKVGDVSTSSYTISAGASWEIDIFGKLRNSKMQSLSALEQSRAYSQYVKTQLIATVANSYYTLLLLDEQLDITRRTAKNWAENTKMLEALMKAGRVNQSSVLQSEASQIALQSSIVTLEQQVKEMESVISLLIARPTQTIKRGEFGDLSLPERVAVGVPLQLLSNRPDVRVAEWALAERFYATGESRSALYPSITLSGSAGYTSGGSSISSPGDMLYSAAASLLQPIFNRGTLRAQLKISKSQQEQALLEFKQSVLDAGAEVNNALIAVESARTQITIEEDRIKVLERAVESSELLMKHGSVNSLEVLTAQLTLLQSELSYSAYRFAEVAGVVDLYRSLGGGR